MKYCKIYKTNKEYIIITIKKTKNWILIYEFPIYRILIQEKELKLIESVFSCLENSSTEIPDLSVDEFKILKNKILKYIEYKSFEDLYSISNSCLISKTDDNNIIISPYKPILEGNYKNGLEVVQQDEIKLTLNILNFNEIESHIFNVLSYDYKT